MSSVIDSMLDGAVDIDGRISPHRALTGMLQRGAILTSKPDTVLAHSALLPPAAPSSGASLYPQVMQEVAASVLRFQIQEVPGPRSIILTDPLMALDPSSMPMPRVRSSDGKSSLRAHIPEGQVEGGDEDLTQPMSDALDGQVVPAGIPGPSVADPGLPRLCGWSRIQINPVREYSVAKLVE